MLRLTARWRLVLILILSIVGIKLCFDYTRTPQPSVSPPDSPPITDPEPTPTAPAVPPPPPPPARTHAIVVLGCNTRSPMTARVAKAAELYHSWKAIPGVTPLLILTGGKKYGGDQDSEAQWMKDQVLQEEVPEDAILLEDRATNTAENALFVKNMLDERKITRLTVITSEFHVDRSRFVFYAVFGARHAGYTIDFVATPTQPASLRNQFIQQETGLYPSSQNDLLKLGLLSGSGAERLPGEPLGETPDKTTKGSTPSGYHPFRNAPRWMLIEDEILGAAEIAAMTGGQVPPGDWPDLLGEQTVVVGGPRPTALAEYEEPLMKIRSVADYGSNYGFFSTQLASMMQQQGLVFSMEGEALGEYNGALRWHREHIKSKGLKNNYICETFFDQTMFHAMRRQRLMFDVQFSLSVFHWLEMPTQESFETALADHLSNARVTFIELPQFRHYEGSERQHHWWLVNIWYEGAKSVVDVVLWLEGAERASPPINYGISHLPYFFVVSRVAEKAHLHVAIRVLGTNLHENKTVRQVLRVDLLSPPAQGTRWSDYQTPTRLPDPAMVDQSPVPAEVKLAAIYKCKNFQ
ncbi:putative DUF218 domain [Paratrimastix pyriformis]|uniref:DUF218 domain n=1 Tax=Paratrimastix pyriformis TaxID=342808 RepID=A0ABQ8URY1_9EUKA|nr:putative DUF218 domain [Paratrimastix pyriformis]